MIKESTIPPLIIQPKLITGCIEEKTSDEKPAIVVKIAKTVALVLESMVTRIIRLCEACGYFLSNSSYLTIRCSTMEIVMISCRAMKFEEMTVISHPKYPNRLVIATTERTQISIGKVIHLSCLKITPKMMMSKITRVLP